jgi:hypothetical protein
VALTPESARGDGRFVAPGTFGKLTVEADSRCWPLDVGRVWGRLCPVDCDRAGRGFPNASVPKDGVVANMTSSCKEPKGLEPPFTRDMAKMGFAR